MGLLSYIRKFAQTPPPLPPPPPAGPSQADYDMRVAELEEQKNLRLNNTFEFVRRFEHLHGPMHVDGNAIAKLARLTGTSLLEGCHILKALRDTRDVSGDWCEYGVATGRTSAMLAQAISKHRTLWLYDSFEGLPAPHASKDVLIDDLYSKGSMAAYEGMLSFPEQIVLGELANVRPGTDWFRITKGWITAESLKTTSPDRIAFAYLDMDFYQSTLDVLLMLLERMPRGGVAIIDDYGQFSEGVRTAVSEVMTANPGAWSLDHPFSSKFVVLTRQ